MVASEDYRLEKNTIRTVLLLYKTIKFNENIRLDLESKHDIEILTRIKKCGLEPTILVLRIVREINAYNTSSFIILY